MPTMTSVVVPAVVQMLLRIWTKSPFCNLFLRNLTAYRTNHDLKPTSLPAPGDAWGTKAERKASARLKAAQLHGALNTLICWPVRASELASLQYSDAFDNTGSITLLVVLTYAVQLVLSRCFGMAENASLPSLAVLGIAYMLWQLAQAELTSEFRGWSSKAPLAVLAGVGTFFAACLLALPPHMLLDFDPGAATKDFDVVFNGVLRNVVAKRLKTTLHWHTSSTFYLVALMSVVAGLTLALLLAPALDTARLLDHMDTVPAWAAPIMPYSWISRTAVRLSVLLPLLVMLLPFPAMLRSVGLSAPVHVLVWPVALLVVGLVGLVALRTLNQAHLHAGLRAWHKVRHGAPRQSPQLAEVLQRQLIYERARLAKVALRLTALPCIAICCGVLLLVSNPVLGPLLLQQGQQHRQAQQLSPDVYGADVTAGSLLPDARSVSNQHPAVSGGVVLEGLEMPDIADGSSWSGLGSSGVSGGGSSSNGESLSSSSSNSHAEGAGFQQFAAEVPSGVLLQAGRQFGTFVASFLGWWACTVWSLITMGTLLVYRVGLHVG